MKKPSSVILILILSFSRLFSGIDYGFKIGMTSATQIYEYSEIGDVNFENRYGYNSGIYIEYPFFKYISLMSDIYYTQRGMLAEVVGTVIADNEQGYLEKLYKYDNRLDYLGISINSKINYEIRLFKPYLLTGIRYEFLVNKETSGVFEDVYSKYDGNIIGLLMGLGAEIDTIFPFTVLLEGVYNYDITKVEISEKLEIYNSTYEIKFGVKF